MESKTEHIFIENIIYYPSQIYYYFRDQDDRQYVAYVRQRSGPLTFELVEINKESGEWKWNWEGGTNRIKLSRTYDINGQLNVESEEKEIESLESEIMWYLRQQFPNIIFPEHPERQKRLLT